MDDLGIAPSRHKLDVDAYYRMAEAGILGPNDRVELIDGEIIDMAPIGSDHGASVNWLVQTFVLACQGRAWVSVQNPVRLDRLNEPEPDLAICRIQPDNYRQRGHPGPADVFLVVEVSDSSLRFDNTVKLPLYARFAIPEVWIVDLHRRVLEAHRDPLAGAYTRTDTYGPEATLFPIAAPQIEVSLARLFD